MSKVIASPRARGERSVRAQSHVSQTSSEVHRRTGGLEAQIHRRRNRRPGSSHKPDVKISEDNKAL